MSQSSPFGHPVQDDPTGQVPVAPEVDGPPEKKTRVGLLAVAGAGVVAGAALLGFLLMSGTSDDDLGYTGPIARAPKAEPTASPSPSATPLPTESTVNARNPFLAPPSPSTSGEAGGSTGTTPAGQPTANPGTQQTTPPATTTSPAKAAVLVRLDDLNETTGVATFKVKSEIETGKRAWKVVPGDDFGKPLSVGVRAPFYYDAVVIRAGGKMCTSVKYVDNPVVQICQGEELQVQ